MINITVHKANNTYIGFEIIGHANFDEYGQDIVCAAVSILSTTALNSMNIVTEVDEKNIIYDVDEKTGFLSMKTLINNEKTNLIYKFFIVGIESLLESYSDYITLKFEEV